MNEKQIYGKFSLQKINRIWKITSVFTKVYSLHDGNSL
jgi:hypothetical protein